MAFKQPNLSPLILERFLGILGVAFQFYRSLGFHLVRWRVKVQQILSIRSWGSKPSLLSGFITIVGEVHIILFSLFLGLSQPVLAWKEAIMVFLNFFAIFFGILYNGSGRYWSEQEFLFSLFLDLSHPVLAWKEAIMVFFIFLKFFAIFLEFFISGRVGTDRNDNFYFHSFSAFPNLFWLEKKK